MNDKWKSAVIAPQATLAEAISILDRAGLRIALVVDNNDKLLGTLTDGDVRRALLRQQTLQASVAEVMCATPQTAHPSWSREQILNVMERKKVLQLPIVDGSGRIVGLELLSELLDKRVLDNPVFLMAGGFGKRLHPLTQDRPKPLLNVGDTPILELILRSFIEAGFHRFFMSTHYLPEMIREHFGDGSRWGVSIRYVHEEEPLGTGGALGLLPHDEIDHPVIMMNGDLLTRVDYLGLLDFHMKQSSIATMCVREYEHQVPYGVIECDGHRIKSMVEKPVQRFFVNAGIYVLSPQLIKSVPPHTRIDMPTLLEQSIERGADVTMFPVHEYWLDIGRMEDFKRAQIEFKDVLQ